MIADLEGANQQAGYRPVELTSRLALKVAVSPLQRIRWNALIAPLTERHNASMAVAAVLIEMANWGKCDPSIATIARLTGLSTAQVSRGTRRLEVAGLVQRTQRYNSSTVYLLVFPKAP